MVRLSLNQQIPSATVSEAKPPSGLLKDCFIKSARCAPEKPRHDLGRWIG